MCGRCSLSDRALLLALVLSDFILCQLMDSNSPPYLLSSLHGSMLRSIEVSSTVIPSLAEENDRHTEAAESDLMLGLWTTV